MTIRERWAGLTEKVTGSTLVVRAKTLYASMSPRDRRLFLMLVSFFTLLIVSGGMLSARNYLRRIEQDITRKNDQLARVEQVRTEHEALKGQIAALEEQLKQNPDFNLTSFLEKMGKEVGFEQSISIQSKGEVANEGYREVSADVKIRKASLDRIVRYLFMIETAPQRMNVKSLRIRTTFGSRADLDADLEVSLLAPQET